MQAIQGIPTYQSLQGAQGIQAIQGVNPLMLPQGVGIIPNPNLQGGPLGVNQLSGLNGANGIPLNLLMTQNSMQQQNDKNKPV
ncbi:MAG: hypothetical protein ACKO96_34150 [Flammeovirgaceae bacterium]